jgi:hypothetical protein
LPLEQGDVLRDLPVIQAEGFGDQQSGEVPAVARVYDFLILSQSCDIAAGKIDMLLGCPVVSLETLMARRNKTETRYQLGENLRKGKEPAYCLLNKCELPGWYERDFLVADFRVLLPVRLGDAKAFAANGSPRLRLLPPYREYLAQSFAYFIARIGLPDDLPPFEKKPWCSITRDK